jgi:SAM-dependent methyltransferase
MAAKYSDFRESMLSIKADITFIAEKGGIKMMYGSVCAEFYDADKKFAPLDEINFYQQFLAKKDLILEPMCGSGRLLIPLLQQGYTVHGVDNSEAMLKSCKERALASGLHPLLFASSAESMSLPHRYDAILIPLGSFQLFYPRAVAFAALKNLKKHLKAGGKLILDLFIPWDALYENNEEEVSAKEIVMPAGDIIRHEAHNKANKYEQYFFALQRI